RGADHLLAELIEASAHRRGDDGTTPNEGNKTSACACDSWAPDFSIDCKYMQMLRADVAATAEHQYSIKACRSLIVAVAQVADDGGVELALDQPDHAVDLVDRELEAGGEAAA